ncbi:glutamate synthase subunit beta [Accumulibacter sp.]|uniref:glutamate synthase subunit beta n=1 Tax=Accumulibacter sp. TaxID=2053492 RepID=UPI0025E62EBF|nr:glutamate synthase subunit beta [Accumulibacter sp.]MCM8595245.1 glutamate synthase subunit beta [Accumulibacter sp.]MCM8626447.1 glutamate synthase subunit beta [Accumulibacter sp.]MDS4049391.1 glutamate synthase subunit beta [Accumulibacter sp.]
MGKPTGFIEYQRLVEVAEPPGSRLKHYREFVMVLSDEQASLQGARCMDCGIPFCNTGCPVNNIIPDWNDLVYRGNWQQALTVLHSTNNFPDFTGRICPAPCEAACTLNINTDPVGIKSIEHAIADKGWEKGWIVPEPASQRTGKKVAIVGSGPAGLAAAQQLARVGHEVVVFEKNDRPGGLLRYGIPDFKLEKAHIDRRIAQMQAEGVEFRVNQEVGGRGANAVPVAGLLAEFDALIVAGGAEAPRDLPVPGRDLDGVHFAMEFLPQQNRVNAGDTVPEQLLATGKHVIVIGGGDTGSDCVGTSNRHGALSVTQFELMPQPPEIENKSLTWPYWPLKLRTSSSHEEGCARDFAVSTKEFLGRDGQVTGLRVVRVEWQDGRMNEVPGSDFEIPADLVLLAMGFVSPVRQGLLEELGVELDARGNVRATTDGSGCYATSVPKVFAAGDMRRGQSLVVWAIREGRQCAREVDAFLMGHSGLPR